jgi:hypothetical protein
VGLPQTLPAIDDTIMILRQCLAPRLVFPEYRSSDIRVSEQEARHLWCDALQETSYYYAVEAPTTEGYIQTGVTARSARTDVAVYTLNNSKLQRVANVEFKAGTPEPEKIRKDLEKLIREKLCGNWFHLLTSSNGNTMQSLFRKFITAFDQCSEYVLHDLDFVFSFCILRQKLIYSRKFQFAYSAESNRQYAQEFFSDVDGWTVISGE